MEFPLSLRVFFPRFVNDPIFFIILVQARGEKRSILDILTWSLSSLGGAGGGIGRKKPVPDLATVSFPKSTADTSVSSSWLTLTQMYKEPHWRTWVLGFCYLKTGGNVLPCLSFVQGDWSPYLQVLSSGGGPSPFRRRFASVPVCCRGFSKLNI